MLKIIHEKCSRLTGMNKWCYYLKMKFRVERQILKLVGATIRTFDANNQLLSRADQKGFKLKEQVTFFHDEQRTLPYFNVQARSVIDLGATYDLTDANGQRLGSLRRKGIASSFIRDEWIVLNANDQEIARVMEDSKALALLRRWVDLVSLFVPQKFTVTVGETVLGTIQQNKNPLTIRLSCEFADQAETVLGRHMVIGIPNMLAIIEQRQG